MRARHGGRSGAALVFVLLLLSALFLLGVTMQFSALLAWLSVRNDMRHVRAEAERHGVYLHARVLLEQQVTGSGALPAAPVLPPGAHWEAGPETPGTEGVLRVHGPEPGRPALLLHVTVQAGTLTFTRLE